MRSAVEAFEQAWRDVRGLTYEFVETVPDARWEYSPHPAFAPLHKQVRHLICVQGVYNQGLSERVADFSRKHAHYAGPLERSALVAGLRAKDTQLREIIDGLRHSVADFSIDFFGKHMSFTRYVDVMLQHEALHHGQWSMYAALGNFETPIGWKLNWGL